MGVSGLSKYGSYSKDFSHKNLNPTEFNLAPFDLILKDILSKTNPNKIEDNENTMWLYESLFTMSLSNKAAMSNCLEDKEDILVPISVLPRSIKSIIDKNFNLVGAQENNESYLLRLINDEFFQKCCR